MLEAESLIHPRTPDQDIEEERSIDEQKLTLLEKLVSNYSDQETGLSSSILNCRFSDTKSPDVSLRLKSEMGDQLNDFLKIVGEFGERDR